LPGLVATDIMLAWHQATGSPDSLPEMAERMFIEEVTSACQFVKSEY